MKLKATITGPKIHEVGYRTFLMGAALDLGIKGFTAFNRRENGKQIVVATVEGNEEQIAAFKEFAQKEKPELAEVSDRAFVDFNGNVMKIEAYSLLNMNEQLNKGINAILRMDIKMGSMDAKMGSMDAKIGSMDAKMGSMDAKMGSMDAKMGSMDAKMGRLIETQSRAVEEIRGIREDIQPGYATNFRQMQSDIRAIKERLGMP